jgi:hypothetical protein
MKHTHYSYIHTLSVLTVLCFIAVLAIVSGCQSTNTDSTQPPVTEEPRLCTADYNPVCGVDAITYSNACMAGKVAIAYRGECVVQSQTTPTLIPQSCKQWFDGCNNCFVENGSIMGCTKKFCQTPEKPYCLEYSIPANCTSWYDGCNTCFVNNGTIGGCTLMYCERQQEPRCLAFN